jgi:hypothetical protein
MARLMGRTRLLLGVSACLATKITSNLGGIGENILKIRNLIKLIRLWRLSKEMKPTMTTRVKPQWAATLTQVKITWTLKKFIEMSMG